MADVRIISTGLVQGASNNSRNRIELTSWDLQQLLFDSIQKGLLLPKPKPTPNMTNVIDHLKLSLSKTLDFFPPLAGRLGSQKNTDDDDCCTVSFSVDCNNLGAQFVHAVADGVTMADILEPTYVPCSIVRSFFSLNGVPNLEGISKPLLAVQVTELVDGFFIGCSMNHCVADGTSFWNFYNSWSQISRSSCGGCSDVVLTNPPVFQPWFPDDVSYPIRIPSSEFTNDEPILEKFVVPPLLLTERVFHFTKEGIAKLKARANSEAGTQNISSLQALLAHLWRTIIRYRDFDAEQEVVLVLFIGARDRLKPSLPKGYFGNAVYGNAVTTTAANLDAKGLGGAAVLINQHVTKQTSEEVKKWYGDWAKTPTMLKKSEVLQRHKLVISSSPRFDMYGNDFGWGKPVAVRSGAGNKFDGKITLFAGAKDGDIDAEVSLSQETLHAMGAEILQNS